MATSALATAFVNIVPGTVELEKFLRGKLGDQANAAGQLAGTELVDGLSTKLKNSGAQMTDIGKKMSLSITAPLTAIGLKAIDTAADFEVAMASLQVNSGASGTEMTKLRDLAVKMGQDTVFSAGEAANAMLELSKGGMAPAAIQGGALQATMSLAATEGMNLAEAATIVTQQMNTFGLSAKDTKDAVDFLAAGAVASTAGVRDLADGMKYVGSTAASLKVPMGDTVTALAALNNAGIDSSTAGTALNQFMLRLIPTTRKAAEEAKALGIDFVDATTGGLKPMNEVIKELTDTYGGMDDAARTASLKTIFGVEGMRAANILLAEGTKGWADLSTQVNKSGIAQDLANARMSGVAGSIEQMKGSIDTAFLAIGDRLAPATTAVSNFITGFVNGFASLSPAMQTAIVTVAGVVAAIGPLLIIAGQLTNAVGSLLPVMVKLWAVMAANPIGALITAIGLVVAGLVFFFTQTELGKEIWGNFTKFLGDAWDGLWNNVLKPVFDFIGAAFTFLYENVIKPIMSLIFLAIGIWAGLWTMFFKATFEPVAQAIGEAFKFLYENVIKPVGRFFGEVFKAIGETARDMWVKFIKPALDAVGGAFKWVYDNIIQPVGALIGTAIDKIGGAFRTVFQGVSDFMRDIFNGLVGIIKTPMNTIIGFVNSVIGALNTIKVDIPSWVPEWGGKSFGLNIPKIPALAKGGYVDQPTYALIGEAGPEVVTPLNDFKQMMGLDGSGGKTINYYAAPNQSLDSEQALFQAMRRAKVISGW